MQILTVIMRHTETPSTRRRPSRDDSCNRKRHAFAITEMIDKIAIRTIEVVLHGMAYGSETSVILAVLMCVGHVLGLGAGRVVGTALVVCPSRKGEIALAHG